MKKRALSILLCVVLCIGILPTAAFAANERDTYFEETLAGDLKGLGLFQGVSDTDFDLDRKPSRLEALVMLIRVMGKESEATNGSWKHPFTDVAQWADKYVGYAFSSGLTQGVSDTQFGTGTASAEMYLTFVLRALGYSDANGADFTWDKPYELAKSVGILPDCVNTSEFWRSDVVIVSYAALPVALKGTTETLAQKLIRAGAFTQAQYSAYYDATAIGDYRKNKNVDADFSYDVRSDHVEITRYTGHDSRANIPSTIEGLPVTSIGGWAFEYCGWLTGVNIPDSVTSIGEDAFSHCISLSSINIPGSVTSIGAWAFSGCESLTSVSIPDSVTSIGSYAFDDTPWLSSRPEEFVIVGDGILLKYNGSSGVVSIPYGVKMISAAFSDCKSPTSVNIPTSVISIGKWAFYRCEQLTSVSIPISVISIGDYAFNGCESLTSVSIPPSVTGIGNGAFGGCKQLISVNIPNSITGIGDAAFEYCNSLASVSIPPSVTSIGAWAFEGCERLTNVSIPASVTGIGNYAFAFCTSLTSVSIPPSVTSIGAYAFNDTPWLNARTEEFVIVGDGVLLKYNGSSGAVSIPLSVKMISSAFSDCTSLTSVSIPASVTSIGGSAFNDCTSLTSVSIPDSVTTIGGWSFGYCDSLISVSIPDSVTNIGVHAFDRCESLTSIYIPHSVTSIGDYAFAWCESLTSVSILGSVTSIGEGTFSSCKLLTVVSIPASVTSIGGYAFNDCTSLTSVSIPDSVNSIGSYAFDRCESLTIYCPAGSYAETYAKSEGIPYVNPTIAIITGMSTYTGTLRLDGLSCYLELDSPICYLDSLGREPVTTAELWLSERDAKDLGGYDGLTVTLEGVLFNYRGGGTLMFDGTPVIVSVSGTPNMPTKNASYPNWDRVDNKTKFWDALEVLRTIVYRCGGVWDVRTLCDGDVLERIGTDGFSYFDPVMLQINGSWVLDYGYDTYVTPYEDYIAISLGPNESPDIPLWKYTWDGDLISGDGTLEEYILAAGLV